jgi:tetratricopeptide (TPR) repeat protein
MARAGNINPAAHDAYLKGRFFWRQRTREGLLRSVDYYRQAIVLEPNFALAHAAIAEANGPLGYLGFLPPHEASPAMRASAIRALELQPDLVEGLTALAACEAFHEWRWRDAEAHFQRAIAVNPNYSLAYFWYGLQLEIEGRYQESLAARLHGLDLDPLWLRGLVEVAWSLVQAGRRDEGVTRLRSTLDLDPSFFFTRKALGIIDVCAGRYDDAICSFEVIAAREPGSLVHALAAAGRRDAARATLQQLEQQSAREYMSPVQFALAHLGLGDVPAALSALEHGVEIRTVDLAATRVDPRFAPLSGEPRFRDVVRRMNLT